MNISTCTIPEVNLPIFENLSPEEFDLLAQNTLKVKYKKGETIFKQGTYAAHIVYIKTGLAKAYIEGFSEILVLKIATPGAYLALSTVSDETKVFPYSAKTYVDTEVLLISIDTLRQFAKSNSKFASVIINQLSDAFNQIIGRFYCITHKQLYGRLADILLCLSEKIFKSATFELNFSRQELSELAKMSYESVIRMLKKFKDDGLIQMEGNVITILDSEQLRKISDYG